MRILCHTHHHLSGIYEMVLRIYLADTRKRIRVSMDLGQQCLYKTPCEYYPRVKVAEKSLERVEIITDELIGKGQPVYSSFPLLFLCLCQLRCLQQNTIDWVA